MTGEKESLYTDISDSLGAPFGGFGTGYFVFGRHGFVHWNVNGFPESQQTSEYPHGDRWRYYAEDPEAAPVALYLKKEQTTTLLQTRESAFVTGNPCRGFSMQAFMPFGRCDMTVDADTQVQMLLYSSAKPHDIDATSIPACVVEITVCNHAEQAVTYTLGLGYDAEVYGETRDGALLTLSEQAGQVCFGFAGGQGGTITLQVGAHAQATAVGVISWYYPAFSTPGIAPNDIIFRQNTVQDYDYEKNRGSYIRDYVRRYPSAAAVAEEALANHDAWKAEIRRWHESLQVPPACLHVWFGSYASLITATLYTTEGYYLEIEQPHGCLNTMDVSVYSTWIFMVNWPEVERRDLEQYIAAIPKTGETAGKVWHSLWADGAHYVEEAIYAVRSWRYALWSGDREFLRKSYPSVKAALAYMYRTAGRGHLIQNGGGNQSYDAWKMPGIGAYVNIQWVYALFALRRMCEELGEEKELCGRNLDDFLAAAIREYNETLWDEQGGYWHAYKTNEDSLALPHGSAVFADQLFGHWAVAIDAESRSVLPEAMEKAALQKIYTHNRLEDKEGGYSCWTNGMMPNREETASIDITDQGPNVCGYHALTCWVSTQMELASLLGYFGMEEESRDVFASVARGMGKNVLAVGEWNRTVNERLELETSRQEPGKDTPRFPPYPRYKSSWEYLIRLLGMDMTMDRIRLSPFRTLSFSIDRVPLAGMTLTVRVEEGWTACRVDGKEAAPVLDRARSQAVVEFIREA